MCESPFCPSLCIGVLRTPWRPVSEFLSEVGADVRFDKNPTCSNAVKEKARLPSQLVRSGASWRSRTRPIDRPTQNGVLLRRGVCRAAIRQWSEPTESGIRCVAFALLRLALSLALRQAGHLQTNSLFRLCRSALCRRSFNQVVFYQWWRTVIAQKDDAINNLF